MNSPFISFDFQKTSASMAKFVSVLFLCLNGLAAGPMLRGGHRADDGNTFQFPNDEDNFDDLSWPSILSRLHDDIDFDEEMVVGSEANGQDFNDVSQLSAVDISRDDPVEEFSNMEENVRKQNGNDLTQQTTATNGALGETRDGNDFENEVLQSLGLPSRPRPSGQVEVPDFMKDLHSVSDNHQDHCTLHHDIRGNIFRSIKNTGKCAKLLKG
jgi:hypothetical protein